VSGPDHLQKHSTAPIRILGIIEIGGGGDLGALGSDGVRADGTILLMRIGHILGPFEKRIALQLFLHEGSEFQIGKLQKFDGLQKLRCHHQGLALAHEKLGSERHYKYNFLRPKRPAPSHNGPFFAYSTKNAFVAAIKEISLNFFD
jgi:hypothetical protein